MRLYEFKAKWIARLGAFSPASEEEAKMVENVVNKLSYLRAMNLPNLAHTAYLITRDNQASPQLKQMMKEMLRDIAEVKTE